MDMTLSFNNNFIVSLIVDTLLYFITIGLINYVTHSYDTKYLRKPIIMGYSLLGFFYFNPIKFAALSFGIVVVTFLLGVFM